MTAIEAFFIRCDDGPAQVVADDARAHLGAKRWSAAGSYVLTVLPSQKWIMAQGPVHEHLALAGVQALAQELEREIVVLAKNSLVDFDLYVHFDAKGRKLQHQRVCPEEADDWSRVGGAKPGQGDPADFDALEIANALGIDLDEAYLAKRSRRVRNPLDSGGHALMVASLLGAALSPLFGRAGSVVVIASAAAGGLGLGLRFRRESLIVSVGGGTMAGLLSFACYWTWLMAIIGP